MTLINNSKENIVSRFYSLPHYTELTLQQIKVKTIVMVPSR